MTCLRPRLFLFIGCAVVPGVLWRLGNFEVTLVRSETERFADLAVSAATLRFDEELYMILPGF